MTTVDPHRFDRADVERRKSIICDMECERVDETGARPRKRDRPTPLSTSGTSGKTTGSPDFQLDCRSAPAVGTLVRRDRDPSGPID